MHPLRIQRLQIVLFILVTAGIAAVLVFWALGSNVNFFYAPAEVYAGEAPMNKTIRVGGLVVPGSVHRSNDDLDVVFTLTDNVEQLKVSYRGILPDLFAEGQGVVAVGELTGPGAFEASNVLAKHDENYMPPEVHEALKAGKIVPMPSKP